MPDAPAPEVEASQARASELAAASAEPAEAEPASAEPADAEPAEAEPASAEPAEAEPAEAEPAEAEPAEAEPAEAEPVAAERASELAAAGAKPAGAEAFELTQAYWPAVEQRVRWLLVVPVGSLEQHGPHLPLDTDTQIAVAVARRACAGRPGVALAPPLPVGASGEHAAFPGTLSIGSEALAACLIELGRHASLHWPALLLVNGHGGNVTAVDAAAGRLRYEGRACLAWHVALPGGDAHAGRSETSIMLALDPNAVRLGAAQRGDVRPLEEILPLLRERGVRAVSANGVLGDPAGASAAEGERLLGRLVEGLTAAMDRFAERRRA